MEEQRFSSSQMQKKEARWCRKCEQEGSEKKQCNAAEGCFKFKTAYAFRTTAWDSIGERLCRHCFHGKKRRKWGHYFCFECGDQKHKKDFQNVVGKLTPTSSRKYLRCDQCVAKHKQREKAQEKQRMTEMTIPEPTTSGTENSAESSEERLFMAQFTALQTWLSKNDDKYPKRRSSDEEETKLANFI